MLRFKADLCWNTNRMKDVDMIVPFEHHELISQDFGCNVNTVDYCRNFHNVSKHPKRDEMNLQLSCFHPHILHEDTSIYFGYCLAHNVVEQHLSKSPIYLNTALGLDKHKSYTPSLPIYVLCTHIFAYLNISYTPSLPIYLFYVLCTHIFAYLNLST